MAKRAAGTLPMHRHCYVTGPNARPGYGRDGKWHSPDIEHSHEGGDRPHGHPDTGPAHFPGGIARAKRTAQPAGPQLPYVEATPEQRTFTVVFVDEYTPGHASSGISRERWEAERAAFLAVAAGERLEYKFPNAETRLIDEFGLTPIYELRAPDDGAPKDR